MFGFLETWWNHYLKTEIYDGRSVSWIGINTTTLRVSTGSYVFKDLFYKRILPECNVW